MLGDEYDRISIDIEYTTPVAASSLILSFTSVYYAIL